MAAQRMRRPRWQQGLDPLPQGIRDSPAVVFHDQAHPNHLRDRSGGWFDAAYTTPTGIGSKPGLARLLRTTAGGLLRIDEAAIAAEERLDGSYLLRCSDPELSAEEIALGYKQLWQIERAWRDIKQVIDLRPVYHRKEERIRAHVLLCWLALLLIRVAENACADSWPNLRRELQKIALGSFAGEAGSFRQRTEITAAQKAILAKLELPEPARITHLAPAAAAS